MGILSMTRRLELKDKVYGKLKVVDFAFAKNGVTYWQVKCECGTVKIVKGNHLIRKSTISCGCFRKVQLRTHGGRYSLEYNVWTSIKSRCLAKNSSRYYNYGARGITMCERWINSFANFLEDMGERPSLTHSIDRIDNKGNYEPGNCRWATKKEQGRNTRRNIYIDTPEGKQLLIDVAENYKIKGSSIRYLMKRKNLTHQQAFNSLLEKRSIAA